jgi:hypothetical protein
MALWLYEATKPLMRLFYWGIRMTMFQRKRQQLSEANSKADEKADELVDKGISILQKLKDEKWTAAALIGGSAALLYLIFK